MTLLVSWAAFAKVQHSTQCIEYKVGPAQLQPGETLAGHMLDAALCCCVSYSPLSSHSWSTPMATCTMPHVPVTLSWHEL